MSKLMEIVEKNPDFKKGTVSVRLLDTTFSQLTRKIGSQPGANFKTAKNGDILSKELLVSLNQEQLSLIPLLNKWKNETNAYIDYLSKKLGIPLNHFEYNFTSLVDYSSKYIPNKTLADYYLLTEFVNAEKEIYEYGHFWGRQFIHEIGQQIKENWSKDKSYGSCVDSIYCQYEIRDGYNYKWSTKTNSHNLEVKVEHEGGRSDFCDLTVSGISKIPIGETATIIIHCNWWNNRYGGGYGKKFNFWADCIMKITHNKLNSNIDDGSITFKAEGTGNSISWTDSLGDGNYQDHEKTAFDNIRKGARITKYTGNGSTHFDYDMKTPALPWLKNRIIL